LEENEKEWGWSSEKEEKRVGRIKTAYVITTTGGSLVGLKMVLVVYD